jgi:hypothetical protein
MRNDEKLVNALCDLIYHPLCCARKEKEKKQSVAFPLLIRLHNVNVINLLIINSYLSIFSLRLLILFACVYNCPLNRVTIQHILLIYTVGCRQYLVSNRPPMYHIYKNITRVR